MGPSGLKNDESVHGLGVCLVFPLKIVHIETLLMNCHFRPIHRGKRSSQKHDHTWHHLTPLLAVSAETKVPPS